MLFPDAVTVTVSPPTVTAPLITFTSTGASSFVQKILMFNYSNPTKKAAYITVFFKSGESADITKMRQFEGDYSLTPFPKDKVVGSILTVDQVTLNY